MSDIVLGSENAKINKIKLSYLRAITLSALFLALSPDPSIEPNALQILNKYWSHK